MAITYHNDYLVLIQRDQCLLEIEEYAYCLNSHRLWVFNEYMDTWSIIITSCETGNRWGSNTNAVLVKIQGLISLLSLYTYPVIILLVTEYMVETKNLPNHYSGRWYCLGYLSWGCYLQYLHVASSCNCSGFLTVYGKHPNKAGRKLFYLLCYTEYLICYYHKPSHMQGGGSSIEIELGYRKGVRIEYIVVPGAEVVGDNNLLHLSS